jgi:hypothetical protein
MTRRLVEGASNLLGIILAVTPVTLWVAWTPAVFAVALAAALVSAALLAILHRFEPPVTRAQPAPHLPEEFIAEVHALFPLTYHHSNAPAARFRHSMRRLSRLIRTG